ncbi:hemopexin repeat-containing protein [Leptolyngbya ohadii]|uniref:Tc toxin subunit A-related protein n=1 Tax=Leptolyngbya ohadii TaxID=1962290 RepID=UPI000B59F8E9|nr:hemopexin repeat-containing protein [Leptolyngbya ohadii]
MQSNIPNYADLFGNLDFKEGDDARSVYSPAAYLSDLLQMLDDEFDPSSIDFDARRDDIKNINLDAENTNTLIPYLDIVNEVLEKRVDSSDGAYAVLRNAVYPFNMPFSLENEQLKNYLHHLTISAHELRRLFAKEPDCSTVAREYLGLSVTELESLVETGTEAATEDEVAQLYGYPANSNFISEMSSATTFMESTGLQAHEMRELLYQKLYVEPTNHSIVEHGRENFYINTVSPNNVNYVTLGADETALVWSNNGNTSDHNVPLVWFARTSRFVRLAKKIGLSFTELDHILRHCCKVNGIPTINRDTLVYIAQVIYIHKTLEQPIDTVVAVLSEISFVGKTNEKLPQDQFNQIFNLPCVSVNEKYLHIEQVMGDIPRQYADSTYHTYTQIDYHADLFSKENDIYRQRLGHSLGFTDTDLINITNRLEFKEVADSSLWKKPENQWQLLNVLYRIQVLSEMLSVHFLELFTLFDLLDQDPFIGQRDPHTYFVYRVPSTQKCFNIFMASVNQASAMLTAHNIGDQLWLLESLIALTRWMKEFGYSAEMLWKIVNGAPTTDRETVEQKIQDLALYNALLQSFKASENRPDTLKDVLGDERASHFAFRLIKDRCGAKRESQSKELKHLLLAYDSREIDELTEDFIRQLTIISDDEFVSLQLESKLQDKIFNNLVNHQIIDGSGRLLTENLVDRRLPPLSAFILEHDFSDLQQNIFELFHRIYQEDAASQLEADDTIEIQVFKSDLKELGLTEAECRELYDDLIYNGYIDEQGFAKDVTLFSDISHANRFTLTTGLSELVRPVYQLLQQQLDKFKDSRVKISEQMFVELKLTPIALQDLIRNLQINDYIDEHLFIQDKMRLVDENPRTMSLALQFYPHREAICKILKDTIAADQNTWLQIDQAELGKIAATTVSRWVFVDLQGDYLNNQLLLPQASLFFQDEANRDRFNLRSYFEFTKAAIVFDHIAGIVNYANAYRLQSAKLTALDFDDSEIRGLKQNLEAIGVLDDSGLLRADQIPFFLVPENAAVFNVPAFSDYDTEIFFQLYDTAKAIDSTVKAVHQALKDYSNAQQDAVFEQLRTILGVDLDTIKVVSSAIFKTDINLHFAWLQPLLENANALGFLDELPANMHYLQAVKRIRQLALLINQQQLDVNEVSLFLKDQDLVAKFPEDLVLPDGITSVDAILTSEEFIYIFKENNYWIYLAADYRLIDKKKVTAGQKDDDILIERQRENQERQKRLKDDPIRQLFKHQRLNQVDAAFIDRYGTWVVVSGESHYVKYANADTWDKRENRFGQVDNDFDTLEMIDAAYVDAAGRLFLFVNDQYVRYSNVNFILNPEHQQNAGQPTVDQGYPKLIAEEWNNENLPIQLPSSFDRDLGPMFDGLDGHSYAFLENRYISSQDGRVHSVAEMWGHSRYDFGHPDHIDAALASQGHYLFFLNDKVVKYAGSIELANLQPEAGYPKSLHQEFPNLPDEFVSGINAALHGQDDRIYLFRNDDYVALDPATKIPITGDPRIEWGKVSNGIADYGRVDAAFVGLDGYTYLFSGDHYVRYPGSNYTQVDDGFPRNIAQDWEGLTRVTGAVVLGNKTYLFGTNSENESIYTRYSTLRRDEEDYLQVDAVNPNARVIETVLANRPDVDEIEVFPATVNNDFWSLPESFTGGNADFQIDAIMNGPNGRIYLFAGNSYIEHDHASRWWSEPKILTEQFDRPLIGINEGDHVTAGFTGTDGKTYLFYSSKYLRFSDPKLHRLDNGYPRLTTKFWGKVRNNIARTGRVDAALVVESRWEEQAANGQLVDRIAMHTYLFSGDQIFRYESSNYSTVEPGYPRSIRRLSQEPRFRGMSATFHDGLDAAFADRRQVYLFKGNSFHVVISDEDNYKQYTDRHFANIQAVTQERGVNYVLSNGSWQKLNHLDDSVLTSTPATPRAAQKAEDKLDAAISATLRGSDGKSYIFAGDRYHDVDLGRSFAIADVWGRSRNPIYDNETIDAAFVGRDGITYVFSGEWFVQYRSGNYVQQTVTYPPQRVSDKWQGLRHVALAYVWEEDTYLFERPDASGNFRYLRYTEDTYDRPEIGYPREADYGLWNIPEAYQQQGFDSIDAIFVQNDTLIFISDQRFISFNLNTRTWGYPQPLALLYSGVPFNRTDFKELKSGFIGANGTIYLFSQHCYVSYDSSTNTWTDVTSIKGNWGLQRNILSQGVDAAWVSSDGVTYLFARDSYVRYSSRDYSHVDEGYPKAIATYLRQEAAFRFMPREFQQYLDTLEAEYTQADEPFAFFNGLLDNGRCLYFFTRDTLFTGSPSKYVVYDIDGLGHIDNSFTAGGYVDAAFVDAENEQTYLFSGEQYIRYTGDRYRYIDEGYPKIIAESLAAEWGLAHLNEIYRDGIDAAFYLSNLGLVLFNGRQYVNVTTAGDHIQSSSVEGDINQVWGDLDNTFAASDSKAIDGAYVDSDGALYVFKEQQFVRYSDTTALFALNPYDEACYVDAEYPRYIREIWPQLDATLLKAEGVDTVFQFEDEIYFHTGVNFVTYNLDFSDHDERKPVQVLSYRWGEWSDYLLSDVHAISRFKALGQRFTGGDLTLTELVSSAKGTISEPYMHFAAIFGFEKREVRWVKQRNAFLPTSVNDVEEDFQLELVLRLYDILATACRLHVDVSVLYHKVWLPLYGNNPDMKAAAQGAYDVLVAINCDNNYATLVNQIVNELNVLKRDALVSYVIAQDPDISTTRQLYQKLLIDIQMSSAAETSRIEEAIGAVQLYLHRYFINLEDIALDAADQQAARMILKDRWQWLRNYRVWEANRKVFLYPENYIRPELRKPKTAAFQALQDSLSQGELTEATVEAAYLKYLDSFTEVSELTIAGGYVYDDNSSGTNDKKLVLFGRTRTAPMRYFYRFGTFVKGDSTVAVWEPWEELDISIKATRVEPVFAFNRVFVFWTALNETAKDPSAGSVVVQDVPNGGGTKKVSSSGEIVREIKVYFSFYNLNKCWTQPQTLETTFDNVAELKFPNQFISDVELFVENSTKLKQAATNHTYENIHITARFYLSEDAKQKGSLNYRAFNLMPELYSQKATQQTIDNRGQTIFKELFPNEFVAPKTIEDADIVKLNYSENSMDGPWFAYNHKGCGFLVKPDAIALPSNTQLTKPKNLPGLLTMPGTYITAAVQVEQDIYYFLDNQTYIKTSADRTTPPTVEPIRNRWGIDAPTEMQTTGIVDSAFVINGCSYLTLNAQVYEYDGDSFESLVKKPYVLSVLIHNLPNNWNKIDAGFTNTRGVHFWFNNDLGEVLRSDSGTPESIRHSFGHPEGNAISSAILGAVVFNRQLHIIHRDPITNNDVYTVYTTIDGDNIIRSTQKENTIVKTVLESFFGSSVDNVERQGNKLTNLMVIDDGIWVVSANGDRYYVKDGNSQDSVPEPFDGSENDWNWTSGLSYTDANRTVYYLAFYSEYGRISNNGRSFARAWRRTGPPNNYQYESVDFGSDSGLDGVLGQSNDRIVGGELDEEYGFDVSTLYNTDVTITGAFTTANGEYLIIITDTDTFYLFDHSQTLTEILSQLKDRSNRRNVADLRASVCLSVAPVNAIWRYNRVDAAFIGANNLGITNALYLFCGNQYLRFTPNFDGEFSNQADIGYPKPLSTNNEGFPQWTQLDAAFTSPDPDTESRYVSYLFNNRTREYYRSDTAAIRTTVGVWGVFHTNLEKTQKVNAAYVSGGSLYLLADTEVGGKKGTEYYRYTLGSSANNNDPIPRYIDNNYPHASANFDNVINAAFALNNHIYLFSGTDYYRLGSNVHEPAELGRRSSIAGSWGNIPSDIRRSGLDAAFQHTDASGKKTLYLIQGDRSISYNMSDADKPKPYEFDNVKYEIIRLTSSTAEVLNQLLFAGGIKNLLQMSTQEMDEVPTISFNAPKPHNIQLNSDKFNTEPTNNHLDFNSANGMYYWEVFFHAPFLIAQTLNTDQQFEHAKQWYEYIFDPTETSDYWKFLPFLAADPNALMNTLNNDLDAFEALAIRDTAVDESELRRELGTYYDSFVQSLTQKAEKDPGFNIASLKTVKMAQAALMDLATALAPYQDVFLGKTDLALYQEDFGEDQKLVNINRWPSFTTLAFAIDNLDIRADSSTGSNQLLATWQREMQEVLEIIKQLDRRIDLMNNYEAQLAVYLEDPFDPHAIAALRPLAYRKAIVMSYIDNLLDWGDMLFRQYTRESIQEARMLYILAHDLLGEKPQNMGRVVLSSTKAYKDFRQYIGNAGDVRADYDFLIDDFLIDLENSTTSSSIVPYEQSLSFAATQFDTITNPYFFLKENDLFTEYWTRVEDRLAKIRACLNIDGVAQPLPLFQPPIDPMALVAAAASGGGIAASAMAGGVVNVSDYRFDALMAKARDLVGKLKNLSDTLLSTLEKKDAEELSLLQNQQDEVMLSLVTELKIQQIKEAVESLNNLVETKKRAEEQRNHYVQLIDRGYLPEEHTQIRMMSVAAGVYGLAVLSKVVSGLSYIVPQITAGPFSFGVTSGGQNTGAMLAEFAEVKESLAEGLSMGGEAAGVVAQFKRSTQDWDLQKKMAVSEITQLDYQIKAQDCRIEMVKRELLMHEKEIENHKAITLFMKSKFSNLELYSWMSGQLSGLFFQTYKLAYDYAKQAEQAFIFEKGLKAGSVNHINGMYWESQRKGLMAGAALELDLDRLEKAYAEVDSRRLEITKNISLLEIDPLALLSLKTSGVCTFRLSEDLFDYDFPGHYNRQIKAVSVAFDIGEGQSVNATLTQLNNKLVMDTDIKAVKHLIDPTNEPTINVRADWRANQQIALSHVDQYTENTGMFELNFGDERYLPFEGTGAVSSWRLELNGKKGSYNPADLLDVTIKLRYTAKQGGTRFANEVKGVLKPYNATSFFDIAYNFPDEWAAITSGDSDEVNITFKREMFPNMNSSKIIGLLIRYQYDGSNHNGSSNGAIFTINNLSVPNNTYLQPNTLSIGQKGSEWSFTLKGDRTTLRNAEMVLVYKANV